jgi:hypothetical protein
VRDRWGTPISKRIGASDDERDVASRLALKHHRGTEHDTEEDFNPPLRSGFSAAC